MSVFNSFTGSVMLFGRLLRYINPSEATKTTLPPHNRVVHGHGELQMW